jgi:hypothetical protein
MYDKSECQTGIVHIGYGAFHRAHQAVYVDDYMEKTGDLRWGIVAVNLRDEGIRDGCLPVERTPVGRPPPVLQGGHETHPLTRLV